MIEDVSQGRRVIDWTNLHDGLLDHIVSFITFSERCRFLGLSKSLWHAKGAMDRRTRTLVLQPHEGRRFILCQPCQSAATLHSIFYSMSDAMESLILDECVDDSFIMVVMLQLGLFPNLQLLRIRSCEGVSDVGLDALSRSTAAASLRCIDISFCTNTSYKGTFCLRDRLPNLEVLRRQPEWLDGQFETPFAGAVDEVEVHVYYADGSFSFNRRSESNGFVCQLYKWDDDFLGDKLQYNNFSIPVGWPSWAPFCFRPGVCLLRLHTNESPSTRTILVGQYSQGLRPPQNRILMEMAKETVPVGESRYFDAITHDILTEARHNAIMISRMRIQPLTQLMPPQTLVDACRNTCELIDRWDPEFLRNREDYLDQVLSVPRPAIES